MVCRHIKWVTALSKKFSSENYFWKYINWSWSFAAMSVNYLAESWRISFRGAIEKAYGRIAIDDVRISRGVCPDSATCDFENDCHFMNLLISDFKWVLSTGESPNTFTGMRFRFCSNPMFTPIVTLCISAQGPTYDHTTLSASGTYAFLSNRIRRNT